MSPAAQRNVTCFHPSASLVPKPARLGSPWLVPGLSWSKGHSGGMLGPAGWLGMGEFLGREGVPPGCTVAIQRFSSSRSWSLARHQFPVDVTCYFSAAVFTTVELSRVIGAESGQPRQLPMRERCSTFPNSPRLPSLLLLPALGTPGIWGHPARRAL